MRTGAERADITATVDISGTAGELRHILEQQSIASDGDLMIAPGRRQRRPQPRLAQRPDPCRFRCCAASASCCSIFTVSTNFNRWCAPATQRALVDSYGRLDAMASQVRAAHSVWLALLNRSIELEAPRMSAGSRLDLLRYQLQEIEALQLKPRRDRRAARRSTRGWPTAAG
jgi:DNA repair ATPase RecN